MGINGQNAPTKGQGNKGSDNPTWSASETCLRVSGTCSVSLMRTSKQTIERHASFKAKKPLMGTKHARSILYIGTKLLAAEVTAFSWTTGREGNNF